MNYDQNAKNFADKIGLEMTAIYTGHRARFSKSITAVYSITLTRKERSYTFDFSTSINDSWQHKIYSRLVSWKPGFPPRLDIDKFFEHPIRHSEQTSWGKYDIRRWKKTPTLYDILACITKSDPGSFKDFCDNYGYDEDSRKAFDVYIVVQKEWEQVDNLFHDVMEELEEIN